MHLFSLWKACSWTVTYVIEQTEYRETLNRSFQNKVNSIQEACAKSCKPHQKSKQKPSIDKKLKTKSLMFFVSFFSCNLQDFKFRYVNREAFGASLFYWVVLCILRVSPSLVSRWRKVYSFWGYKFKILEE